VDDVLRLVGIALEEAGVDLCPSGDRNRDGQITIEEIVAAVDAALQAPTEA